jgi:hypothetical protein
LQYDVKTTGKTLPLMRRAAFLLAGMMLVLGAFASNTSAANPGAVESPAHEATPARSDSQDVIVLGADWRLVPAFFP